MATNKQIQGWVKERYGFIPKTFWFTYVKHVAGLPMRDAPNRQYAGRGNLLTFLSSCATLRLCNQFLNN
jgi:hypothetical protein